MEGAREQAGALADMLVHEAALRSQREMARLWMALNAIDRSEGAREEPPQPASREAAPGKGGPVGTPPRRW